MVPAGDPSPLGLVPVRCSTHHGRIAAGGLATGRRRRRRPVRRLVAPRADASGGLTYRSSGGVYDFVGVPAGVTLDDPASPPRPASPTPPPRHLARYGAAFGSDQAGTTLTELRSAATVTGDVVRYQQNVGGLPVMGGEFVVSLRAGPRARLDPGQDQPRDLGLAASLARRRPPRRRSPFFQGSRARVPQPRSCPWAAGSSTRR